MREERTGKLLRVFVDDADRFEGRPLFAAIVEALHGAGFSGATVLRGIEGYGAHRVVHAERVLDSVATLPVVVEAVEEEAKVLAALPALQRMVGEGLITLEDVALVRIAREERP